MYKLLRLFQNFTLLNSKIFRY